MVDRGMGLSIDELESMAKRCRRNIVRMVHGVGAGHPGGSLSAIDMLTALYGHRLRVKVDDPTWYDRDRFIMSKGMRVQGYIQSSTNVDFLVNQICGHSGNWVDPVRAMST